MARTRLAALASAEDLAEPAAPIVTSPADIVLDRYRAFVFPNRIREQRRQLGLQKLMALSERLPEIPYIRLSKVERGEVVARADELQRIAHVLEVAPQDLLIDTADPGFDLAAWTMPFQDGRPVSEEEERFAVMLAAALRVLRNGDAALTIAALDKDYGLPAVILSRLENAHKTLDRWNEATLAAVFRLFGVADETALRALVTDRYRRGELDGYVARIIDPRERERRTRERIAAVAAELSPAPRRRAARTGPKAVQKASAAPVPTVQPQGDASPFAQRMLPVFGAALPGGLIAFDPTDAHVAAPHGAGPRAFALRVCRATLGAGLPAGAVVVADPDRPVTAGGLAAIREEAGYRLVTVTFDRAGATKGYSVAPDLELDLDALDPADIASVRFAIFP